LFIFLLLLPHDWFWVGRLAGWAMIDDDDIDDEVGMVEMEGNGYGKDGLGMDGWVMVWHDCV